MSWKECACGVGDTGLLHERFSSGSLWNNVGTGL